MHMGDRHIHRINTSEYASRLMSGLQGENEYLRLKNDIPGKSYGGDANAPIG